MLPKTRQAVSRVGNKLQLMMTTKTNNIVLPRVHVFVFLST